MVCRKVPFLVPFFLSHTLTHYWTLVLMVKLFLMLMTQHLFSLTTLGMRSKKRSYNPHSMRYEMNIQNWFSTFKQYSELILYVTVIYVLQYSFIIIRKILPICCGIFLYVLTVYEKWYWFCNIPWILYESSQIFTDVPKVI